MKKVKVYAYTRQNLGDDLFLKILCERYKNTKFILYAPEVYKEIFKNDNNTTTHAKAGPIVVIDALLTPATILLLSIFNSSALCKPALKKNIQLPNKAAIITAAPSHNPGLFIISFNSIL